MRRNRKQRKQKRLKRKRAGRNKRKNRKRNEPRVEWITDTAFSINFNDADINRLFPSITVEIVEEDEIEFEDDPETLDTVDLN